MTDETFRFFHEHVYLIMNGVRDCAWLECEKNELVDVETYLKDKPLKYYKYDFLNNKQINIFIYKYDHQLKMFQSCLPYPKTYEKHFILGKLLGYSGKAIEDFLDNCDKQQQIFSQNVSLQETIKKYFDMEHFKEVYRELMSLSKKSKVKIRFSPKFEYNKNPLEKIEEFFNTPEDKPISEIYKPCMYPYSNMMITPAGDVYPCLSQKIGSIKEMPIKEVFNLPHYRCFRKNLKASKVFGACQMCCELCVR